MKQKIEKIRATRKKFSEELIEFMMEYSVIGLAIGVIVAQISKDLIDAIVKGLFTPLVSLLVPSEKFQNLVFTVNGVKFDVGMVLNALLTFLIVIIFLYIIIKKILKQENLIKKQ